MSNAQSAITDQPVICLIARRIHTAELRNQTTLWRDERQWPLRDKLDNLSGELGKERGSWPCQVAWLAIGLMDVKRLDWFLHFDPFAKSAGHKAKVIEWGAVCSGIHSWVKFSSFKHQMSKFALRRSLIAIDQAFSTHLKGIVHTKIINLYDFLLCNIKLN